MLIGLNEKLLVFNDLKNDVESHKSMFKSSEGERERWQVSVREISTKVSSDLEHHQSYAHELIQENSKLSI